MFKLLFKNKNFYKETLYLTLPMALQSLLYTSLSIIDQFMVGQLGEGAIAGIGLASRPYSILTFLFWGLTGGLGIFVAQFFGKKDYKKIGSVQGIAFVFGLFIVLIFTIISAVFPEYAMRIFTTDPEVIKQGMLYHRMVSISYLPFLVVMIFGTVLRSTRNTKLPMYVSVASIFVNTGFNYLLIFGKFGFPKMGVTGAALATVMARFVEAGLVVGIVYYKKHHGATHIKQLLSFSFSDEIFKKFWKVTLPMLLTNMSFVAVESFYSMIYGHMGTYQIAAMTILFPLQGMLIGFFSGLGSSAGIILGNNLGAGKKEDAYHNALRFVVLGLILTSLAALISIGAKDLYVSVFNITPDVKLLASKSLIVVAIFLMVKVVNMIIVQGILPSGGETKFLMYLGMFGMWVIGLPLGYLAAFVFELPIYWVFAAISVEEFIRLLIGLVKILRKKWLNNLVENV